jgi:DNA-binding transcriptional MerR regulator
MKSSGFLRPGEMARLADVSVDTLRHYERKGLLCPRRSANRYREYPEEALDRVRLVRRALSVGFSLDDLARILKERDSGGAPCRQVRDLAETKLAEVERLMEELGSVRDDLRLILEDWDVRLARAEAGQPARLLEALAATDRPAIKGLQGESCKLKAKGSRESALRTATFRRTQRQRRKE